MSNEDKPIADSNSVFPLTKKPAQKTKHTKMQAPRIFTMLALCLFLEAAFAVCLNVSNDSYDSYLLELP